MACVWCPSEINKIIEDVVSAAKIFGSNNKKFELFLYRAEPRSRRQNHAGSVDLLSGIANVQQI